MKTGSAIAIGSRRDSRLRLDVAARLVSLGCRGRVTLCDLSQSGARIRLREGQELRAGEDVLTSWLGYEAFGQVMWCCGGYAGIEFDELLPEATLLTTRDKVDQGLAKSAEQLTLENTRNWFQGVCQAR